MNIAILILKKNKIVMLTSLTYVVRTNVNIYLKVEKGIFLLKKN